MGRMGQPGAIAGVPESNPSPPEDTGERPAAQADQGSTEALAPDSQVTVPMGRARKPSPEPRAPLAASAASAASAARAASKEDQPTQLGGDEPILAAPLAPLVPISPSDPNLRVPPTGSVLGGIYRVVRPLGEGAMGVILLAQDEHLQRPVAIKLLRPDRTGNESMQQRLLEEARAMARVHHPNVVQIHAFGEYQGTFEGGQVATAPYFVMEYVEGVTLADHARSRGGPPLDIDEALSILDQVCDGVSALHAAGIAHRDLKPSNILVGADHHVAVADLGLAREVTPEPTAYLSYSGTPAYIAPEVALQRPVDRTLLPRVDVYALGLVAYWLLCGRRPFEGKNAVELFQKHAFEAPPQPSTINPNLPPSFDAPLLAALAKEPEQRTATPEDLRQALRRAHNDGPLSRMSLRVLVVDDSEEFRTLVSAILEEALPRAQIVAVPDGLAAIAEIQEHPPALAIIDLTMPGMDGIELTAAIRGLPEGGDFPIVVVTGTGGASDWQRLSALGASAFLVKPFDSEQLVTLSRRLLEGSARAARS